MPHLILGAEYGAFVKIDNSQDWISLVYENFQQAKWKDAVLPIVKDFGDRTPGTDIEVKEHSITWFYGDADPAFGEWQAKDMHSHLEEIRSVALAVFVGYNFKCLSILTLLI